FRSCREVGFRDVGRQAPTSEVKARIDPAAGAKSSPTAPGPSADWRVPIQRWSIVAMARAEVADMPDVRSRCRVVGTCGSFTGNSPAVIDHRWDFLPCLLPTNVEI